MKFLHYITTRSNLILAIGLLLLVFVGLTLDYVEEKTDLIIAYNYYSKGYSIGYFLISLSMFSLNYRNGIYFLFFSLTLNNLLDELFFNNTELGINELIVLSILLFIYYKKYYVSRRSIKNRPTYRGDS